MKTPMKSLVAFRVALAAGLLVVPITAGASVIYNGDFRLGDASVTQADTLSDQWVYDNVNTTEPHVTTIWGNFIIYQQYEFSSLGLKYQVRRNVSAGSGGTLVASGSVANLQQSATGRTTQNGFYREVQLLGTVSIDLTPGTYWIGLQNNEGTSPPAQWTSFLAQTVGGDNGPAGDPNPVPQNYTLDHSAFGTGLEAGDWIQQGADYSIGVTTVPEPASAALLAGVVLVTTLRRRW